MRHFSCDLCGKDLTIAEVRFVLRMEVYAAMRHDDEATTTPDDDATDAMAELLDAAETDSESDLDLPSASKTQTMEYDLCPGCRVRFAADPLGRDQLRKLRFSQN